VESLFITLCLRRSGYVAEALVAGGGLVAAVAKVWFHP
jgi:hypothetical protein